MWLKRLTKPPWRTIVPGGLFLCAVLIAFYTWSPGLDVRDGRHDRRTNGMWLQHGWLGDNEWFIRNGKTNRIAFFRDRANVSALRDQLRAHHITDVFPHLAPASYEGDLPSADFAATEAFLDELSGFRVIPWIGGVFGEHVRLADKRWRDRFVRSIGNLLDAHPRLAGVQLNVEPLTSGDSDYLLLLDEIRAALPSGKILSIVAYPPPTRWHPYPDVHWELDYFSEVSKRCDQLAVMMYDTALRDRRFYQKLMADWTTEVLAASGGKPVLLGVPTYDDVDSGYHDPRTENLETALLGIHRGLEKAGLPVNYRGVAIYCEWETDLSEWNQFTERFLAR